MNPTCTDDGYTRACVLVRLVDKQVTKLIWKSNDAMNPGCSLRNGFCSANKLLARKDTDG